MNEDYLWDRTGEPDPEIQQLEQVLGTLRYQPRTLELPATVRIGRPRTFITRIAIAAAVAAMLISGVSWLLLQKQSTPVGLQSGTPPADLNSKTASERAVTPAKDEPAKSRNVNGTPERERKRSGVSKSQLARSKQLRPIKPHSTYTTARDRAEAQAAKEHLLLALRVASAKLNLAQKKAQGAYPGSLIRNQHKVG
jgi:hypothetical protein